MTTVAEYTDRIMAHKRARGFNTTDVSLEFNLLTEELGEAIKAWRRDPGELPGELADLFIFLLSLASMLGVDLEQAVIEKMAINAGRQYVRHGVTGHPVKVEAVTR